VLRLRWTRWRGPQVKGVRCRGLGDFPETPGSLQRVLVGRRALTSLSRVVRSAGYDEPAVLTATPRGPSRPLDFLAVTDHDVTAAEERWQERVVEAKRSYRF
jgi:hypothetical protein